MAGQLLCDLCEAEPAQVMQSSLANGDTIAIGANCALTFYVTCVSAILADMPAEAVAEYGSILKPVLDTFGYAPEPPAARPPAKRKQAPAAEPPADPDGKGEENGQARNAVEHAGGQ